MANKKVTVFCGISGAGKSFERKKGPYKSLPFIDMGEVRKRNNTNDCDWIDFLLIAEMEAKDLLMRNDHIVIEGYFLPGSLSREFITKSLETLATLEFIFLNTPLDICLQRLKSQFDLHQISKADYIRRSELAKKEHPTLKAI